MNDPIRVAVLFGGQSAEHEVSLQSVQNILQAMNPEKMEPVPVAVDHEGRWYRCPLQGFLENADNPNSIRLAVENCDQVTLLPWSSGGRLIRVSDGACCDHIDVAFPVLHGPYGEDGTLQGLLKLSGIPFVGCGVLSAALTMDKGMTKKILAGAGVPHAPGVTLQRRGFESGSLSSCIGDLQFPLFVKPSNLGSSVGVARVESLSELEKAVADALLYDHCVVVEKEIKGQEVECAVLGNEDPVASIPGEIIPRGGFYSYEAKYLDPEGAQLQIPARITPAQESRVQELAVDVFRMFQCRGMARIDFFVTPENVFVNELNAIPGFTRISMYPKLWEASGLSYSQLVQRLVELALESAAADRKLRTSR